jgi:hypothetical protein
MEALLAVESSIQNYNGLRPHMSSDYLTPSVVHESGEPLVRQWKRKGQNPISGQGRQQSFKIFTEKT